MESLSSFERRTKPAFDRALWDDLAPMLVAVLIAAQGLFAIALVARRFAGAVTIAAAPAWLIAAILTSAILAAVARSAWFTGRREPAFALDAAVLYGPLCGLLLTAAAVSAAHVPAAVLAVVWLLAVGEEIVVRKFVPVRPALRLPLGRFRIGRAFERLRRGGPMIERAKDEPAGGATTEGGVASKQIHQPPHPALSREGRGDFAEWAASADACVQRFERVRSADGCDLLAGLISTRLRGGQSRAYVHVAFCPPFAAVPQVDFRQVAGPAARVKAGQVLPHGARFDVKLDNPAAEAVNLVLEVRAVHEPNQEPPA